MLETSADRIQHFRSEATVVREKAGRIPYPDLSEKLMEIARGYDALADVIERRFLPALDPAACHRVGFKG
jgi:hypothetical protein